MFFPFFPLCFRFDPIYYKYNLFYASAGMGIDEGSGEGEKNKLSIFLFMTNAFVFQLMTRDS